MTPRFNIEGEACKKGKASKETRASGARTSADQGETGKSSKQVIVSGPLSRRPPNHLPGIGATPPVPPVPKRARPPSALYVDFRGMIRVA
jgi:hypothetical protein